MAAALDRWMAQRFLDFGQYPCCKKFNGLCHLFIRQSTNVNLGKKTLVSEQFVLIQDLVGDLLRTAHKQAPFWTGQLLKVAS